MKKIVGISFKENGKIYYFDLNGVYLNEEKNVIVSTDKGLEYGTIMLITDDSKVEKDLDFSPVLRLATEEDTKIYNKNIKDAKKSIDKAQSLANDLGLVMNFIDASFTFERKQLLLYYTSNGRVDFRELAKSLAGIYKTRIELRQVGVRDKAKEISGIGPCGQKLCCSRFLKDLDSVTIDSAKNQNIVLNPNKINGLCGRLLCCLNYEDNLYIENKKGMPELGKIVETPNGNGPVISIDIPNRKYIVYVENIGKVSVELKD